MGGVIWRQNMYIFHKIYPVGFFRIMLIFVRNYSTLIPANKIESPLNSFRTM